MTMTLEQSAPFMLSATLSQRLAAMRWPVLRLDGDGRADCLFDTRWIDQIILGSPQFTRTVRQHWPQLIDQSGLAVELWPGLYLAPLPLAERKRTQRSETQQTSDIHAVMMLGRSLLEAEQMRQVCDSRKVDYQATLARIDPTELVSDAEANRLAAMLTWMCEDHASHIRQVDELQAMTRELAESYEELSLLYKLSSNMTVNQSPSTFLTEACSELQQVLGVKWLVLQLVDDEPRLEELAGHVFSTGDLRVPWNDLKDLGMSLSHMFAEHEQPVVIDETASLGLPLLQKLASSVLIVPLRVEGKPLGMLYGGDKINGDQLGSTDSKLCGSLASSMTIFLQNMMLYEDAQAMFLGTLHALTSAIDAKDSYTHGHSERVAVLSRALAEAAGFDRHTCERVYLSGLVHDVGKIGVPESVLCKPGRLTDVEFGLIKRHPVIGAHILQDIRQMQDLIPGVLYHHERWDGRGYPHGLSGEKIPLFGRIIALADAFDAMSSDRTYRRGMSSDEAMKEVRQNAGTQFDPALAPIFLDLDMTPFYRLIEQHERQMRKSA